MAHALEVPGDRMKHMEIEKIKKELVAQVVCGRRVSVKAAVNQESAARANATWISWIT